MAAGGDGSIYVDGQTPEKTPGGHWRSEWFGCRGQAEDGIPRGRDVWFEWHEGLRTLISAGHGC